MYDINHTDYFVTNYYFTIESVASASSSAASLGLLGLGFAACPGTASSRRSINCSLRVATGFTHRGADLGLDFVGSPIDSTTAAFVDIF